MSALATAVPPLPVLSVLFARFGSGCAAVAVALLSKAPAAVIVAVTLMVVFAPDANDAIVQGSAAQAPETVPIVMFVGVSVNWIDVAVDGPALATTIVWAIDCPAEYGPAVVSVLFTETSADVESGTIFVDWFEFTGLPVAGSTALAVAVFVTCALLTSVGVTVYVAVQVMNSPGSRKLSRSPTDDTGGHVTVARLSDTVIGPPSVAKPLFVTR